ncbi:MAG: hypothetical protein MR662_05415 [Treponema porcinum]|uniref:hypothetical protein n=1 Tax=Treponema porcinum TaxID=261392 RepID=UPI0023552A29|nr:hypothetical protein [Treponema porcinum]MCI6179907.1 hypothetical protein [Treponema porcinum]MCI6815903.1 hypothetical protein [Treponema porcinum]MCI6982604.1 hypothetical protein [Treponema porcinum]MCI7535008.1 hypothetical protein [Treponema porcinum]MDD7126335.1 hypothetical protein [Treponema porcinum]
MIQIDKVEVFGWEAAIRGMRNSFNSWDKSDSCYNADSGRYEVGPADIELMDRLSRSGPSHAKFLRYINVTLDITAPRYWWAEMDTYKVGTVRNSCSTMHKVQAKEFERADFSCEHLDEESLAALDTLISVMNRARDRFNNCGKNKDDWWQMIQLLPASLNQKATVQLNYQVLQNIYFTRKDHRLDEWHTFCRWIEELPYSQLIIGKRS